MLKTLTDRYLAETATDKFLLGAPVVNNDNAQIRVSVVPVDEIADFLTLGRTSKERGGYTTLRFRPTVSQKYDMWGRYGYFTVCTVSELKAKTAELKELASNGEVISAITGKTIEPNAINNGHALEWFICDRWGKTWEFDNTSHTIAGDIERDNLQYQVKYTSATLLKA